MRYRVFLMFCGLLLMQPGFAASLREALEHSWQLDPAAQALEARRAEIEAERIAAGGLLPDAPALLLGHRSDRIGANNGMREWEAGVAMPLWLPGQRAAQQRQALAAGDALEAALRAQRLRLAGELREAVWRVREAQTQLALDAARAETARRLADDVLRRERAGELARTDRNLAQNEWRAAEAESSQSRSRLFEAEQAYALLTGLSALPEDAPEPLDAGPALDEHPLLAEARLAVVLAEARVEVARRARRDNPELELSARRERDGAGDVYASSIGIGVRLPLPAARKLPLLAAAQAELIRARGDYERLRRMLEAAERQAQQQLEAAGRQLELARAQRAAAEDNLGLIEKSFQLGESDLVTLLRARSAAHEARQRDSQQEITQALARARLNQARGVLP